MIRNILATIGGLASIFLLVTLIWIFIPLEEEINKENNDVGEVSGTDKYSNNRHKDKTIRYTEDLAKSVSYKQEIDEESVQVIIELFLDEIENELLQGNQVKIEGFGSFLLRVRAERQGRNPQTGELITIPKKKIPSFTVDDKFTKLVNSQ